METENPTRRTIRGMLRKNTTLVFTIFAGLKVFLNWLVGCALLWLSYGMSIEVGNENRTQFLAMKLVMGMSFVISILTTGVWLLSNSPARRSKTLVRRLTGTFLWTALALSIYLALVLVRRNLWTQDQGMTVYDQFLPVVGRINAEFLSEYRWLIFLIEIIPVMSLTSALLWNIGSLRKQRAVGS